MGLAYWRIFTGFKMASNQVMQPGDDGRAAFGDDAFGGERFSWVQQTRVTMAETWKSAPRVRPTGCASAGIGQHAGHGASPRQARH